VLQIILHFQVFGQSHLMTKGGPNDQTQVLVRYIYQTAFRDSDLGEASAMAVFLFVIMGRVLGPPVPRSDGRMQ
jgi:multiple sugar transport system permease protein